MVLVSEKPTVANALFNQASALYNKMAELREPIKADAIAHETRLGASCSLDCCA